MSLCDLVSDDERRRTRAIRELPASDALAFALRRVLYTDAHAGVRAAAARRLGDFAHAEPWLLESLAVDGSPLVRDTILRALARVGGAASHAPLRALVAGDRMWWVRRSAIYVLAALAGASELPAFTAALGDPFWRVRQAAVRVLAVLGARDPDVRDEVLAAPPSSTIEFLRASWGPVAVEAPARATSTTSRLPAALLDPDPAVVTARLLTARDASPLALVELLCDPHAPLRLLAARRIAAANDAAAFTAALDWLEEPRIPHVVDTVHGLLDRLGDAAATIAARALARADRPGAAAWAIGWVVATRSESLYAAARARATTPALRRLAVRITSDADLLALATAEPTLRDAIAVELHARRSDALAALDGTSHPRVRALQVEHAARAGRWDVVAAAATDLDNTGPRAIAARWLAREDHTARDPDPAVREAALTAATAGAALASDLDPWVRRAAARLLADSDDAEAALLALADPDPWIRARACRVSHADDRVLAGVLRLLVDRDHAVRAAAHAAIETVDNARIDPEALTGEARRGAYSWLLRALDDAAVDRARAALASESDLATRRLLAAVCGETIELPARSVVEPAPVQPSASVERRPLADFTVAPLAVSGAYDLPERSLAVAHAAGVDLYFWEPGYSALTRFLRARTRRDRVRVVAGTYHADAASIRADVDRALRRLRRDTLDAFLLFWTRSPARLDAFDVLDDLKRAGKLRAIGFSTHHRDLAHAALEARAWDVVMIRHSAAHPGIERPLLPTARERGTAVLTFSALTYGRMLTGPGAPTAAECYRYSLAQPGVTAVISAPRRHAELLANLGALAEPTLAPERIAALREFGLGVRAESQRFNTLLRQPTRDAAAAARELLASEPPPTDAIRIPRSAARSRTRLGR